MESKGDKSIAFLDLEVGKASKKIQNIGILIDTLDNQNHTNYITKETLAKEQVSLQSLNQIFATHKPNFICGHNFICFDKSHLANSSFNLIVQNTPIIDTLYLSLLLFPDKSTHKLEKPYKQDIHRETPSNSPLQDCKNTKNLFAYLCECFEVLPKNLQDIFTLLLKDNEFFKGFFLYCTHITTQGRPSQSLDILIKEEFGFEKEHFKDFLATPLEFGFVLSFINALNIKEARYFSPYILRNHPRVVHILKHLQSKPSISLEDFAKDEFGISNFRKFTRAQSQNLLDVQDSSQICQKDIIKSALNGESFLAILPTGGGKTFTFQLPALIKARQYKSLTVVISPLQALMQNHIESFKAKNQNFCIEAISGFLNPIERFSVFDRLLNGTVDILYLAPESLRSTSIYKALQKRHIERFVIDEAHCFSMWGHNFRQDYHFIAQTIKDLESSPHQDKIAVSCFTATAKPKVIDDIKEYFAKELGLELKEFIASSERKSLSYEVITVQDDKDKFDKLWQILLMREQERPREMPNPTIIYIPQNARLTLKLSQELQEKCQHYGLNLVIEPFYAKLDDDVAEGKKLGRKKSEILQDFMDNKIDIVIATTAFGMGIDKPDITTIIHYCLSDSLESYIQESGRGARDEEKYQAKCFILYDKRDIDNNFAHLRRSNLDFGEIKSLMRVLKTEQKAQKRNPIYVSLKSLHKKLGKDEEDYEPTLIKTALLELEKAKIIKRKRTKTQIYATSFKPTQGTNKMQIVRDTLDTQKRAIQTKSKEEQNIDELAFLELYEVMILIVQNIIQRSRQNSAVSLDELGEIVGSIEESKLVMALKILEQHKILASQNDIALFVDFARAKSKIAQFFDFEEVFFDIVKDRFGRVFDLRECNDEKLQNLLKILGIAKNPLYLLKFIIKSWEQLLKLHKTRLNATSKKSNAFLDLLATLRNCIICYKCEKTSLMVFWHI